MHYQPSASRKKRNLCISNNKSIENSNSSRYQLLTGECMKHEFQPSCCWGTYCIWQKSSTQWKENKIKRIFHYTDTWLGLNKYVYKCIFSTFIVPLIDYPQSILHIFSNSTNVYLNLYFDRKSDFELNWNADERARIYNMTL